MSDRELLELAAKAAGYKVRWCLNGIEGDERECFVFVDTGERWEPQDDDGDALRLLAARELHVSWEYMPGHVLVEDTASDHHACVRIINGDRASALRRAATACMAEIGRAMP